MAGLFNLHLIFAVVRCVPGGTGIVFCCDSPVASLDCQRAFLYLSRLNLHADFERTGEFIWSGMMEQALVHSELSKRVCYTSFNTHPGASAFYGKSVVKLIPLVLYKLFQICMTFTTTSVRKHHNFL